MEGQGVPVIRLCGPLLVTIDDRRLEAALPSRQGRLVFAYLVLRRGRPVSRDELTEALWPERVPGSPDNLLTGLLSRLRRVLPPGLLEGRSQLSLRLDRDAWIDVEVAERAPALARQALAAGDPATAIEIARAALEILEQPLLPDLERPWVDERRRELDELVPTLLELVAGAGLAAGELTGAQAAARRLIEREPFRESAHALLMEVHAARGDVAEALRVYDALRTLLRDELGTIPAGPVRALSERLLRDDAGREAGVQTRLIDAVRDQERAPWPRGALPASLANTTPPVGRAAALARLEAAWAKAAAGTLAITLLTGEPGIGKTTLVGELARRVYERGAAVLYGRCDSEALVPYQPWVEALERHLQELPAGDRQRWLGSRGAALARLLPGLGPAADADPTPAERYVAFEAVRALVEETAAVRPLLLVLDDLHWADRGSLLLLRHLARLTGGARALVATCVREDELSPPSAATLAELRQASSLVQVPLAGLDEDDVGALLARRTGTRDPLLARRLLERTAGNPFFLDELLRDRQDRGEGATGPPPGVRDVVARRIARLGPPAQEALSFAAVIGSEFDVGVIAVAGGWHVREALQALDGAAAAGLIAPAGTAGRYVFAHALIAETLLATLPMSHRAGLHLRVADAMEPCERRWADVPAGRIAWHLRAAGPLADRGRRVTWEVAAAREAESALAHEEAARHYEESLAALPAGGAPDRADLLLALGHAYDRSGRRKPARRAFLEAARLARERGDRRVLASAALGHGGLAVVIAAPDPGVTALLEEALAAVRDDDRATRARLLARLAIELCYSDPARAEELSAHAVTSARAAGDRAALAAALNARRVALWSPAHADERLAAAGAMVEAASAAGDRETALQGRNWRVVDLMELGRLAEAAAEVDAYDALARAVGLPHYRWYVPLWRSCLALVAGRWSRIVALSEQALGLGCQADDPNAPFLVRLQAVHALAQQGRFADVDRDWVAERAADPHAGVAWKAGLALVDAEIGDVDRARPLISQLTRDGCAAIPMNANWHAAALLAEAAARVGDREAAAALYALLAPHARLFPVVARGINCYGSTEYFLGRLAATFGRLDEAEVRLRRAIAENDRVGSAPRVALTLAALGDVLAARAQSGPARDALAEAAARAQALDMPALAAKVHRALDACPTTGPSGARPS